MQLQQVWKCLFEIPRSVFFMYVFYLILYYSANINRLTVSNVIFKYFYLKYFFPKLMALDCTQWWPRIGATITIFLYIQFLYSVPLYSFFNTSFVCFIVLRQSTKFDGKFCLTFLRKTFSPQPLTFYALYQLNSVKREIYNIGFYTWTYTIAVVSTWRFLPASYFRWSLAVFNLISKLVYRNQYNWLNIVVFRPSLIANKLSADDLKLHVFFAQWLSSFHYFCSVYAYIATVIWEVSYICFMITVIQKIWYKLCFDWLL